MPSSRQTCIIVYVMWRVLSAPDDHFAIDNDFTGKKVVTFRTSTSPGLGQSSQLLAQAAGSGEWRDDQRFSSGASKDEVHIWAKTL